MTEPRTRSQLFQLLMRDPGEGGPRGGSHTFRQCTDYHCDGGDAGTVVAPRTDPVPVGAPGRAGTYSIKAATWQDLSSQISASHVNMMLNAAELDYINGRYSEALGRLMWLKGCIDPILATDHLNPKLRLMSFSPGLGFKPPLEPKDWFPPAHSASPPQTPQTPRKPRGDIDRLSAQHSKIVALLQQLKLGLDYFGRHHNFVFLQTLESYEVTLNSLFRYADDIEQSFLAYQKADRDIQARRADLLDVRNKCLQTAQNLRAQLPANVDNQVKLQSQIDALQHEINSLWVELQSAEVAFQKAVTRTAGCQFKDVMIFAAAVATLYASGGTAYAAIGVAYSAMATDNLKDDKGNAIEPGWPDTKYRLSKVYDAGKSAADFANAYDKAKGDLNSQPQGPTGGAPLPSDEVKLVADAEAIERELQRYSSLSEARSYESLIRNFVSTAQTRNNLMLQYAALVQKWYSDAADADRAISDADALDTQVSTLSNPFIKDALLFMDRATRDAKSELARLIYTLDGACRFYTLEESTPEISTFTTAALKASGSQLIAKISNYKDAIGRSPQKFSRIPGDVKSYVTKTQWKSFADDGILTFTIPYTEHQFKDFSHIHVTGAELELVAGGSKIKEFRAVLLHHGSSILIDQSGRRHAFTHSAIPTAFRSQNGGSLYDNTIADAAYAGPSPFATWTVSLEEMNPTTLKSISGITLYFYGYGLPRA